MDISKKQQRIIEDMEYLTKILQIIGNPKRRRILELCYGKPRSISELVRELDSSYKIVWNDVKLMDENALIWIKKENRKKGKPVYVESFATFGELLDSFGYLAKDMINKFARAKLIKKVYLKV